MQKIPRIAAVLLVVVALFLALAAFSIGRHRDVTPVAAPVAVQPPPAAAAPTTIVVVASHALPAGQPIALGAVRVVNAAQKPSDSYGNVDDVSGQVPRVDIPEGAVLTASLLSRDIAMALKPGERALAVPVDEIAGVGNRVLPGDYVDVFLSLKTDDPAAARPGMNAITNTQTRLLLSRLRVLAYGSGDLPSAKVAANDTQSTVTKADHVDQPPRMAVLAVPVNEVDRLLLGVQNGKLSLALRHPVDIGRPDDTLFPQPSTVLTPLASLSAEQRQWIATPENRAYAGINGDALAGKSSLIPRAPVVSRAGSGGGVEIIRGSQRNDTASARTATP
ncbi:Flp pilus assembly protein CpaB [Dyella sp. 20L07]|uniref:Flp pilus assembly protein CpaB n=1 Tax=Dyella sp. 20L07 TaxID=3384240 RepID=UPI003D299EC7